MAKRNKRNKPPKRLISRSQYKENIRELTGKSRRSMRYSLIVIWLLLAALLFRSLYLLFDISINKNKEYTQLAASTHTEQYTVYPDRGNIYAANGSEVAISTYTYTIGLTPSVFGSRSSKYDDRDIEAEFAKILDIDLQSFRNKLKENKDASYMLVKRNIDPDMNDKLTEFIEEKRVSGVTQDPNQSRFYPLDDFASSTIGFANKTDQALAGVSGIEQYYNDLLAGSPARVYQEVDNYYGQALPGTLHTSVEAQPGQNLRLTIQEDLQSYIQDLNETLYHAGRSHNGSQIIVFDVDTGGVVAYTSELEYNLNKPMEKPKLLDIEDWDPENNKEQLDFVTGTVWSNKAIRYPAEMGSVVKPFVFSMALQEGLINDNTMVDDSPVVIDGWRISSYDNRNRGLLTPAQALWDSRNPPFVRLAMDVGMNDFYNYLEALGMYSITGVDLPNETRGLFHQNPQKIDMAVTAFGEQVTMTLMQLSNAYLALANDGVMIKPHFADAVVDTKGNVIEKFKPEVKRQVFSGNVEKQVRNTMIGVGRYGTAKQAYVPGVEAAYKTGTTSQALFGSKTDNVFSHLTISLLPADKPKYLALVVAYDQDESYTGITYNTIRNIDQFLVDRDNMPVNYKAYDYNLIFRTQYPLTVKGEPIVDAANRLFKLYYNVAKKPGAKWSDTVKSQYPPAGYAASFDNTIWLSNEANDLPETMVSLPDFTGLRASEARKLARSLNLNVKLQGYNRAGEVTNQYVMHPDLAGGSEVGDEVREYSQIVLEFDGEGERGPVEDDSIVAGEATGR